MIWLDRRDHHRLHKRQCKECSLQVCLLSCSGLVGILCALKEVRSEQAFSAAFSIFRTKAIWQARSCLVPCTESPTPCTINGGRGWSGSECWRFGRGDTESKSFSGVPMLSAALRLAPADGEEGFGCSEDGGGRSSNSPILRLRRGSDGAGTNEGVVGSKVECRLKAPAPATRLLRPVSWLVALTRDPLDPSDSCHHRDPMGIRSICIGSTT